MAACPGRICPTANLRSLVMSEHNREIYEDQRTARHYRGMGDLFAAERAALTLVAESCRGARILDLGVGGGRTTPYLLAISSAYTGADYADAMVQACRERYPGVRFELADAPGNLISSRTLSSISFYFPSTAWTTPCTRIACAS